MNTVIEFSELTATYTAWDDGDINVNMTDLLNTIVGAKNASYYNSVHDGEVFYDIIRVVRNGAWDIIDSESECPDWGEIVARKIKQDDDPEKIAAKILAEAEDKKEILASL